VTRSAVTAITARQTGRAARKSPRAGVLELSWRGAVVFASTRHPKPTAIAGFGVALWLLAAARKRNKEDAHEVTPRLREFSSSLVDTATRVFGERAAIKQREFIGAAQTHVATGAARLSDAIEDNLKDVIDRVPGGSQLRLSSNRLWRWRPRQPSKPCCSGTRADRRVWSARPRDLDPQFVRIGWLLVGVDDCFDQRWLWRTERRLNCRSYLVRLLAEVSFGAASPGKGDEIDR
jgi:hypothetical protein